MRKLEALYIRQHEQTLYLLPTDSVKEFDKLIKQLEVVQTGGSRWHEIMDDIGYGFIQFEKDIKELATVPLFLYPQDTLRDFYYAGFLESGEGYNAEVPYEGKTVEQIISSDANLSKDIAKLLNENIKF